MAAVAGGKMCRPSNKENGEREGKPTDAPSRRHGQLCNLSVGGVLWNLSLLSR